MIDDDDTALDQLLRSALTARDVAPDRAAAVRDAAHAELRRATGKADRRRRALRALEAGATFALGAAQLVWAIASFLDRPY